MKKRKAAANDTATTIKKPTPKQKIKGFTFTKHDCVELKVAPLFANLPIIKWSEVNELIRQLIIIYQNALASTAALNIIIQSMESIHRKRSKNKNLCHYISKCTEYLKQDHIRALFQKKFASKVSKFQVNELKKKNRQQGNVLLFCSHIRLERNIMSCYRHRKYKMMIVMMQSSPQGSVRMQTLVNT